MKKFIILLMIIIFCVVPVSADMGPKPTVKIDINGLEGKTYYVTLLSKEKSTGPHNIIKDIKKIDKNTKNYDIILKFYNYKDEYYYLNTFEDCSQTHRYEWNYFPPDDFKILIYILDTNTFICSDKCSRYAFDSYYDINVNETSISVSTKEITVNDIKEIDVMSLIARIIVTIFIEIIIAWFFNIREYNKLLLIAVINILTQLSLNICLYTYFYNLLIMLEIMIMVIETIIYKLSFNDISTKKIICYGIAANFVSFILGQWLKIFFPTIF